MTPGSHYDECCSSEVSFRIVHTSMELYCKMGMDILERIQRRENKLMPKLKDIRYEMRLKESALITRRLR